MKDWWETDTFLPQRAVMTYVDPQDSAAYTEIFF